MMSTTSSTYGRQLEPGDWNRERSLIQSPSLSGAGNIILRVGREWESGGSWHQTEHVVLSPDEAASLTAELGVLQDELYVEKATLGALMLRYVPDGVDVARLAGALELLDTTLDRAGAGVPPATVAELVALAGYLVERLGVDETRRLLEHSRLPEVTGEHLDEDHEEAAEDRLERMDAVEVNAEAKRIIGEDKVPADELRELLRTYGDDEATS